MFNENPEALAAAEKAQKIPTGSYEADITSVTKIEARGDGKFAQFCISFTIADGEYEGADYPFFLTLSPKAIGVRSAFYSNIGYVRPEDGNIDENDWIGLMAKIQITNDNGQVRIQRVNKSARTVADTELDGNQADGEFGPI